MYVCANVTSIHLYMALLSMILHLLQSAMVKMPEPKHALLQYLGFSIEKVKFNPNLGY